MVMNLKYIPCELNLAKVTHKIDIPKYSIFVNLVDDILCI